jgi:hypothetical protein
MLAAEALKITSRDLKRFGVVDEVIPEPPGGAHRDHAQMANTLKAHLLRQLRSLQSLSGDQLVDARYERFRRLGVFTESAAASEPRRQTRRAAGANGDEASAAEGRGTAAVPGRA